jgi:hypothetical protein
VRRQAAEDATEAAQASSQSELWFRNYTHTLIWCGMHPEASVHSAAQVQRSHAVARHVHSNCMTLRTVNVRLDIASTNPCVHRPRWPRRGARLTRIGARTARCWRTTTIGSSQWLQNGARIWLFTSDPVSGWGRLSQGHADWPMSTFRGLGHSEASACIRAVHTRLYHRAPAACQV